MAIFQYEVFAKVVACQTFNQAAQALHVTPSAISHSINQFETELGFPLFIRRRTGVELTSDGQAIYPLVQAILNMEAQLKQVAANIQGLNAGSIRIGAFSSVCINWLPPVIQAFRQQFPSIEISIIQGTFTQIEQMVRQGRVDLGFSTLPVDDDLIVEPLLADPIRCVTPTSFVPANRESVTLNDIGSRHFILQQIDYDGDTKKALDRYDVTTSSISYSIDDQSILSMVESDLGLGILPELALQKLTGRVHIYPFDQPFYRTICMISNKVQVKTPSTRLMIETIRHHLAEVYDQRYLGNAPRD
ncbi:LysR family transcriptional regulator [Lapidilactobacillus achengensis]|uniref:LysR family transcriptional regulator n=1 Tax=Lapidilactobacillus achengensis TaxID=2486000 RepID=A0ABW1UMV6_9LACO|nr:LysR family transcriptional regulator [Lapidilactobacillus achengensis]